jgi:site-specific recombinase XerD
MNKPFQDHHTAYTELLKKQGKSNSTILAYTKDVEQFLTSFSLTHESYEGLSEDSIQSWAKDLEHQRYNQKSIVRKINSLKSFFSFLQDQKVLTSNPIMNITRPKITHEIPRILTKTEYRALRDACRTDTRTSAIVELLLQTGIRISELATLTIDAVDSEKKVLTVTEEGTNKKRNIPLNKAALRSIEEYMQIRPKTREKTMFLTKTCRPYLVRNIRASIDRYFTIAGIKEAKVNDLRHTFIVEQLAAGVPLVYVSQIVGHKRITTTEKYLQLLDQSLRPELLHVEEL